MIYMQPQDAQADVIYGFLAGSMILISLLLIIIRKK